MSAPDLLDTNILVYAYDRSDRRKQQIAQKLLKQAIAGEYAISTQVLSEFAVTLLYKLKPAVKPADVSTLLDVLAPVPITAITADIVRRGVEAHALYGVHFWDGMLLATAEAAGSARLLSEDLNADQQYFSIRVENPF
jgi:predicted nucleic acid-binding protein